MGQDLAAALARWRAAGLVDEATAEAIAAFEARPSPVGVPPTPLPHLPAAAAAAAPGPARPSGDRISVTEALTNAGAVLVLAGVIYETTTGGGGEVVAGVVGAVLALAAAAAGLTLLRSAETGAAAGRAAASALTVAAGLAAYGAGRLLDAAGAFSHSVAVGRLVDGQVVTASVQEPDRTAVALVAAAIAAVLGLGVLGGLGSLPAAMVTGAAIDVTAGTAAAEAGVSSPGGVAATVLLATAVTLLASTVVRGRGAAELLRFIGLVGAVAVLQIVDGSTLGPWTVAGGVIAATSLAAAVRLDSDALALAGGVGVFAFAIGVTARTLGGSAGAPTVLVVSGLALIGCGVLTQRALRRTRGARVAATTQPPQD